MILVKSLTRHPLKLSTGGMIPPKGHASLPEELLPELLGMKGAGLVAFKEPGASAPAPKPVSKPKAPKAVKAVAKEPEASPKETEKKIVIDVGVVEATVTAGEDGEFGTADDEVTLGSGAEKDLMSLLKKDLVEMAEGHGIDTSGMAKKALVAAIEAAE